MADKPDAPAARRNREPIAAVLRREFAHATSVLEIGSGTGQHAVWFARVMPWLDWQTSDRRENLAGISAWVAEADTDNVHPPLELDVLETPSVDGEHDAVFSANTAHIMSMTAVEAMFRLVGNVLGDGGVFFLYGPFNIDGDFTSESNRDFDRSLRGQDPAMGIRDLSELDRLALDNGMVPARRYAMPANNMLVSWRAGEGQA